MQAYNVNVCFHTTPILIKQIVMQPEISNEISTSSLYTHMLWDGRFSNTEPASSDIYVETQPTSMEVLILKRMRVNVWQMAN